MISRAREVIEIETWRRKQSLRRQPRFYGRALGIWALIALYVGALWYGVGILAGWWG